jgi:hypothetical protein
VTMTIEEKLVAMSGLLDLIEAERIPAQERAPGSGQATRTVEGADRWREGPKDGPTP